MSRSQPPALPDLVCACATIRRTARLVTLLYSRQMGQGVEPTQFALLTALQRRPGASQSLLGHALGLDKTTMSRNLTLMRKKGWIELGHADDRRERGYRLRPTGARVLRATQPAWERAQAKLRTNLKPGDWETLMEAMNRLSKAALAASDE